MSDLEKYCYNTNDELLDVETSWWETDNEVAFELHKHEQAQSLIDNGFLDENGEMIDCVKYSINEYGFRTHKMENLELGGVMVLGDSISFGLGNPVDHMWVTKLEKQIDKKVYNLSAPGGSHCSAKRIFDIWYDILQPSCVIFVEPPVARTEFWQENIQTWSRVGPWNLIHFTEYAHLIDNDEKNENRANAVREGFKEICDRDGVKLIVDQTIDFFSEHWDYNNWRAKFKANVQRGRDLAHPGEDYQSELFNRIYANYVL